MWILFPKDIVPPGIMVSEDQSEVEAPLSLAGASRFLLHPEDWR